MELTAGKVAVVTGAASGIGLALAERFARAGLDVVLADVEQPALQAASEKIAATGAKTLAVPTDVSDEAAVNALAAAAVDRFGAVHVVCNNAGVASLADPWFGPLSAWKWVLGVNLWGVIHGIRAFLPVLAAQGEGHIVNTASMAGLIPGAGPVYDATKHAVVAISEDLYRAMTVAMLPIGVSVLCPGWVRTSIYQADRNWPQSLGEVPPRAATAEVTAPHAQRAIDEGMAPAAVADLVADAVAADRFWVFTDPRFTQLALGRWQRIAEGRNPRTEVDAPGMPPAKQITAEIRQLLAGPGGALWRPGHPGPRVRRGRCAGRRADRQPPRMAAPRYGGLVLVVRPALSDVNFSSNFPRLRDPVRLVAPLGTVHEFNMRYPTLGFSGKASLDEGTMWPVACADGVDRRRRGRDRRAREESGELRPEQAMDKICG